MSANETKSQKQVIIKTIRLDCAELHLVGETTNPVIYPGAEQIVVISTEDFEDKEDYHNCMLALTKAARRKLTPQTK